MVILGGLEVVAAGYLIHKHQKNKKERERIEDERAEIEEEEYRHRPSSHHHRRHRSHSRRRHSHDRPHSHDGRYGRENHKPKPILKPAPMPAAQSMYQASPQYDAHPNPPQQRPQDVKYGWTDNTPAPAAAPQQQQTFPVTGWPAHWEQSQRPPSSTHLAPQAPYQRAESSRGRSETRGSDSSPRVRFAVSTDERGRPRSISPPPKYRP
jgi:hypothetical protein